MVTQGLGGKATRNPQRLWGKEELKRKLTESTYNMAQVPRWSINNRYTHGWTGLNANDFHTSSEISRKCHKEKEVNDAQATRINEINLTQNMMSKVHKHLDHHHMRLAASKEVLTKHL